MGFDSELLKLPRYGTNLTDKEIVSLYLLAIHNIILSGDWHQKQIQMGHTFPFDECDGEAEKGLPKNIEAVKLYENDIQASGLYRSAYLVDSWCSPGLYIDDDIKNVAHSVYGLKLRDNDIFILDKEAVNNLLTKYKSWQIDHPLQRVTCQYGYKYEEDGKIVYYPLDGIIVDFEDDTRAEIEPDDDMNSLFAYYRPVESDKKFAIDKLVEALESIKDTMDDSVVIYFGGW